MNQWTPSTSDAAAVVLDAVAEAYVRLDEEFRATLVNRAAERLLGCARADLLGRAIWDVVPATAGTMLEAHCRRAAADGASVRFEAQVASWQRWYQITAGADGSGGIVVHFADVTERRLTEDALRDSDERLVASQKIAGLGSYVLDFATGTWESSAVLDEIFGIDEGYPRSVEGWKALIAPESQGAMLQYLVTEVVGRRARFDREYRIFRHRDGQERWVHGMGELDLDTDGRPLRMVGTILDITDRKHAEARLLQAQKMESVGRLAGGVAHDFNNLLTVINGYCELLLGSLPADDPTGETLAEIRKAGERAAALTRQLLAFSRKQILQPRRLDVNRLVADMVPMLERLMGAAVDVRVEADAGAGAVYADPHQLEQVIVNLALNARDAMPSGGRLTIATGAVEWTAERGAEAPPGRYSILSVTDNGTGIDEATRHRIFEPFFTTKAVGQGTGLGLSTVQGIVVQSGGHVDVESEPGKGTTFRVFLPAVVEGSAPDASPVTADARRGTETVLVVEDQADVRQYVAALLEAYGYDVVQADGVSEGLMACERGPVDLLLTDVVLPQASGRDLAERLVRLHPGLKVLFMSGYAADHVDGTRPADDGRDYIQKPFGPEALAGKVRALLGPPCR